jgi:hypothetical protein
MQTPVTTTRTADHAEMQRKQPDSPNNSRDLFSCRIITNRYQHHVNNQVQVQPIHHIETEHYIRSRSVTPDPRSTGSEASSDRRITFWSEWQILPSDDLNYNANICCRKVTAGHFVVMKNKLSGATFQIRAKCLIEANPSYKYMFETEKRRRLEYKKILRNNLKWALSDEGV